MFIQGPINNPTLSLKPSATNTKSWQVGQLLKAFVLEAPPGKGDALLNINGQKVSANLSDTSLALQKGQSLTLEVAKGGSQPVLRVLSQHAIDTGQQAMRQALPLQQPLNKLFSQLQQLSQNVTSSETKLPASAGEALQRLSRQIIEQLPDLSRLKNPTEVKRALENSGNFLESKLAQLAKGGAQPEAQNAALQRDLKAGLLRLLAVLKENTPPAPATTARPAANTAQTQAAMNQGVTYERPQSSGQATQNSPNQATNPEPNAANKELAANQAKGTETLAANSASAGKGLANAAQQIETGLARIQVNQLNSLQTGDDGNVRPNWAIELPIRQPSGHMGVLDLNIRHDREAREGEYPAIWSISLNMELNELGPLRVGLTLVGEKQISVSFWADREETVNQFQQHLETLKANMNKAGLAVGSIGCQQGKPPPPPGSPTAAPRSLVDTQA